MKKIGMPLRRAEVEALMRAVDENSDGKAAASDAPALTRNHRPDAALNPSG